VSSKTIKSLNELEQFAGELAKTLAERQIVLLIGAMGAGKTQLVRFLVSALGGQAAMSPTFAIHNQYETERGPVDHVDLYRLETQAELENTGFWDLFARESGLVLVEWADRVPGSVWPKDWKTTIVAIHVEADGKRKILVT
jgi:tRNA threonylcarbamoyladenosine biosynthesis protein TsaE